jgi:hypothetical protein
MIVRPHPPNFSRRLSPTCAALLALTVPATVAFPGAPGRGAAGDGPRAGSDYTHSRGIRGLHQWDHFPITVYFDRGGAYTEEREQQALAGFDEWVDATGGVLSYTVLDPDEDSPKDADVTVRFMPGPYLPPDPQTVGRTETAVRGRHTLMRARMAIAVGDASPSVLTEIAAHEFGHALGINGHSDDPDDLMFASSTRLLNPSAASAPPRGQKRLRKPTVRDVNTIKAAYRERFAAERTRE